MEVEEAGWIGGVDEMEAGTAGKGVLPEHIAEMETADAGGGATTAEEKEYWEYEQALTFRDQWTSIWAAKFGSFDDITAIQPMRYTDAKAPGGYAQPLDSLQIYSIDVAEIRGGLRWPVDVYGMIAARDVVDRNRNVIFDRSRVDCQTLTKEVLFYLPCIRHLNCCLKLIAMLCTSRSLMFQMCVFLKASCCLSFYSRSLSLV
ncbi:uncharacterized protein [Aegilops tauschii subsp. strangulata]|uniref:uncharacterized protein isoform X1 n=1 Tax=Aegilops tauschii subsp. strangulata TaxID=200361 RepID=UPI003CC8911A